MDIVRIERLLNDCRALHSHVSRIESELRLILADGIMESENAHRAVQEPLDGSGTIEDPSEPQERQEGANLSVSRNPDGFIQGEMFPDLITETCDLDRKIAPKCNFNRKKGCPTLTRAEIRRNFSRIAKNKVLLSIAEVNQIFGYNRTTSGTFVKNAVNRGDLVMIPVGGYLRFLSSDINGFINHKIDD